MLNFLVLYVLEPQATILLAWYAEESLCNGPVSVHLSVRLSVCPIYRPLQLRAAGLLLGARPAGRRYRSTAAGAEQQRRRGSKREQCHVYSRRMKLNPATFASFLLRLVQCSVNTNKLAEIVIRKSLNV